MTLSKSYLLVSVFVLLVLFMEQGHGQEDTHTCKNGDSTTCAASTSSTGTTTATTGTSNSITDDDDQKSIIEYKEFINRNIKWDARGLLGTMSVDWGETQRAEGEEIKDTIKNMYETYKYMTEEVNVDPKYNKVRKECKVRNELCSFWAALGECEVNPSFMTLHCAPSCKSCDQIDFQTRCPYDYNAPGIWNGETNELNRMFERIVTDPKFEKYSPTILSRDPWVVMLDDFISEDECQRLIDLGAEQGYKRSEDVGEVNFDGTTKGVTNNRRTSTNAWCFENCFNDTMSQAVTERMEDLIEIPQQHYEYLQLLRYEKGQFYQRHHDYIEHDLQRPQGVRILTVYMYLNDVEAGGGTDFPLLKITVSPKRGRVIVWPSVLNHRPNMKDMRTDHEALPVKEGIKYGANAWVHQRDFKEPHGKGCI